MHLLSDTTSTEQADTIRQCRAEIKTLTDKVNELQHQLNVSKKKERLTREKINLLIEEITHTKKQLPD